MKQASLVGMPSEPEVILERLAGNGTRASLPTHLDLKQDGIPAARDRLQGLNVRIHFTPMRFL
ncbi:hypothetical protein AWB67_05101 [Caballeronia terrestris]|uniref:Uncharacterized protein n=1 Tax=Caballeronia terrestris TaxID=1226301 RepID=A0A158K8N5_9BURK|nr:hypothetical protein AWB67_05101 [Caballeronia terrestris]